MNVCEKECCVHEMFLCDFIISSPSNAMHVSKLMKNFFPVNYYISIRYINNNSSSF